MLLTIITALLFAKIKHYNLRPLIKAYALYPLLLLEIGYWVLQATVFMHNYFFIQYASYVKSAYLYVMFIPIIVYKLYKPALYGSVSVLVGTVLNRLVMSVNGGKMPVYATLSRYTGYYSEAGMSNTQDIHCVGTAATKLKILTDYIDVGWCILSIGDLFVHAFTFIILFYTIKCLNNELAKS
ncbi:MAG: DUF5317 family protein [Oscillospiraceae bacterium]|nr:DUF5317 family protein [Oscillospiraceae bacterium]